MIGVKDQYVLSITPSGYDSTFDFHERTDLNLFTMIESAGNTLPIFELVFITSDPDIVDLMSHEGVSFDVMVGRNPDDCIETKIRPTKITMMDSESGRFAKQIRIDGVYDARMYLANNQIRNFTESLSNEVVESVAGEYFVVDTNVSGDDEMNWLQYNCPDKKFLDEVWLHSYVNTDTFQCVGITSDGKFRFIDMREQADTEPINFMQRPRVTPQEGDVIYSDHKVICGSGLMNAWVGTNRKVPIIDFEDGTQQTVQNPIEAMIVDKITRGELFDRSFPIQINNRNTHDYWWQAYQNNLTKLGCFSGVMLALTGTTTFYDVKVLDLANVTLDPVGDPRNPKGNEAFSGKYFVSKVSRQILAQTYSQTVMLSREGINVGGELKGTLV